MKLDGALPLENASASSESRAALANALGAFTLLVLLIQVTIFILAILVFATGHSMGKWLLPLSVPCWLLAFKVLYGPTWRELARTVLFVCVAHIGAYLICGKFFDSSWDGPAYHQEAVLRLAAGWNPLFQDAAIFGQAHAIWLNHYPKLTWINGAAVFLTFGQIEPAKLFNLTVAMAAGAQVASTLLRLSNFSRSTTFLLAALAAFNPVVLCQCVTFYIDGWLGSLLTVLFVAFAEYAIVPSRRALLLVITSITLIINIKFNGLAYFAIFSAFATLLVWNLRGFRAAVNLAIPTAITGLVAVFVIGYSPYTKNIRQGFHMLYPAYPPTASMDLQNQRPANLNDKSRFLRFLISNFSESESIRPPNTTRFKFPFLITRAENGRWWDAGVEVGGFGPLYGGLLVITAIAAFALLLQSSSRALIFVFFLGEACLVLSIFSHGEGWWARYVPQAWLLPLLVAAACLLAPRRTLSWYLGFAALAVAAINSAFVGYWSARHEIGFTNVTNKCLQTMRSASGPITIDFGPFESLRERFKEAKIDFRQGTAPRPMVEVITPWQLIPTKGLNQSFWSDR